MDKCKICDNTFKRKYRRVGQRKIYCSKKCRYTDNYITKICMTCASSFTTNKLSTRKDYCSLACIQRSPCQICGIIITGRAKFQSGKRRFCSRRCASIENNVFPSKTSYSIKGYVSTINRIGFLACEICKNSNPAVLIVHHKNRDRTNISTENLQTLCSNCHFEEHWSDSNKKSKDVAIALFIANLPHLPKSWT